MADSSTRERSKRTASAGAQPPQQSQSSNNSNLDSFFKRLGQGQSSRLWAGPRQRSGAAVPGSLRTRIHARTDDSTGGSGNGIINSNVAADLLRAREGKHGATASAEAAGTRRQRSESAGDLSLSPLGTTGGWSELEGTRRLSVGERRRDGRDIDKDRKNHNRSSSLRSLGSRPCASTSSPARCRAASAIATKNAVGDGGGGEAGGAGNGFSSEDSERNPLDPLSAPPPPPSASSSHGPPRGPSGPLQHSSPARPRKTNTSAAAAAHSTPAPAPVPKPSSAPPPKGAEFTPPLVSRPSYRDKRFDEVLAEEVVKLDQLRQLSWNGVPPFHRAAVWQLLVGYMPANRGRRTAALERKRREYREAVPQYFDVPDAARSHQEQNILRQILVDVPRTCPDVPFFHQDKVQRAMERILYIWAIRHPASGYVQGMNDLMTPLYVVFLSAHVGPSVESTDVSKVDEALLFEVEADVYWCLTKLLDNIQDHYTAMQPGLQRMVLRLEELVQRIDADLHRHIVDEGLLYIQFAFRWMNCLLMRELPLRAVVRAWDTYLAEDNGFGSFHVYVSAALLCHFSVALRGMDFQSMVMFLQDMPTKEWGEEEVEPLLSQAYILSTLFENSPNHLSTT